MPFVIISENFLKLATYLTSFGYYARIMPWKLTLETNSIKPGTTGTVGRPYILITSFNVLTRIGIVVYIILTAIFMDLPEHEFILGFCNILTLSSSAVLLIIVSPLSKAPIEKVLHGFFQFNEFHMKIYGMRAKRIKNDPLVKFTNTLVYTAILSLLATGPAMFFIMSMDWKIIWLPVLIRFPGMDFAIAVFWVYLYAIDWTIHIFMLVAIFAYCNVISSWLARNICKGRHTTLTTKRNLQILYRGHQVLHRHVMEWIFYLIPLILGMAILILIFTLYAVIGLYHVLDTFLLTCCSILAILVLSSLKMFFQQADMFTQNSKSYPLSFQRMDQMYTKLDRAFFKSLTPIVWWIGHWMECTNSTFAMIMQDIVITWVINLILWKE